MFWMIQKLVPCTSKTLSQWLPAAGDAWDPISTQRTLTQQSLKQAQELKTLIFLRGSISMQRTSVQLSLSKRQNCGKRCPRPKAGEAEQERKLETEIERLAHFIDKRAAGLTNSLLKADNSEARYNCRMNRSKKMNQKILQSSHGKWECAVLSFCT